MLIWNLRPKEPDGSMVFKNPEINFFEPNSVATTSKKLCEKEPSDLNVIPVDACTKFNKNIQISNIK